MCQEKNSNKTLMFYINVLSGGGAERVICNLANMFSAHGYTVYLVASEKTENEYRVAESVKKIYLECVHKEESYFKRNIGRVRKLRRLCKSIKPDVVVSFMAEPNFRAIIATLGLKIDCIVSVRNDPSKEYAGRINGLLAKILFRLARGCVFQTEDAKKWFPQSVQKKSKVILNQVNERFFLEYASLTNATNIVSVGRLVRQKNHALLINAFADIAHKYKESKLVIYGEGPLREELEELVTQVGLEGRVILPGAISDVPEKLSGCKCFVLSSDYEGMPNALLEAMALGCPCISTDCPCGGARMVINDGENGILVHTNDKRALSAAMERILGDHDLANNIARNAKERSLKFHPDVIFGEWEDYVIGR